MKKGFAYFIEMILVIFAFSIHFLLSYEAERESFIDYIEKTYTTNFIISQSSIFLDKDIIRYLNEKKFNKIYNIIYSLLKRYYEYPNIKFKIILNISYNNYDKSFPVIISVPEGVDACISLQNNFTVYRNWKFIEVELLEIEDIVNLVVPVDLDPGFDIDLDSIIVFSEDGDILCSKVWEYEGGNLNISVVNPTKTIYIYYKEKSSNEGNIKTNIKCYLNDVGINILFTHYIERSNWYTVYINRTGSGFLSLTLTFPESCKMREEIMSFSDYNASNFIFFMKWDYSIVYQEPIGSLFIPTGYGQVIIMEYG